MSLSGCVAVVTGGGTGIGRAISIALAGAGAGVAISYRSSASAAEETLLAIREAGGTACVIRADVRSDSEMRSLMLATNEEFGRLDILVNNAGFTKRVPHRDLESLTDELIDNVLDTNVRGPLYAARAAIPHMLANGEGYIVNISSQAAITATGSSIVYAASKAALSNMTRSLARAFAPEIRVNSISPGYVHTGFGAWPADTAEAAAKASPIGRIVSAEDIAATVMFLCTGGAMLTGEDIVVDGGVVALGRRE